MWEGYGGRAAMHEVICKTLEQTWFLNLMSRLTVHRQHRPASEDAVHEPHVTFAVVCKGVKRGLAWDAAIVQHEACNQ